MTPTLEQAAIVFSYGVRQMEPVFLVDAGPGCAKSTTLGLLARAIPATKRSTSLACAFGRDAVEALATKLPPGFPCKTFNSIGGRIWSTLLGHQANLNAGKTRAIIRSLADGGRISINPDDYDPLMSLVTHAKALGYLPPKCGGMRLPGGLDPTLTEVGDAAGVPNVNGYATHLNLILSISIKQAYAGIIDFDDQGYMAAMFAPGEAYPRIHALLVDEAQDLTPLQLRLLERMKPDYACYVGDPLQAIYAFRGAMSDSFARIRSRYPTAPVLPLQTSFRLPLNVVEFLQSHNPKLTTTKNVVGINDGNVVIWGQTNSMDELETYFPNLPSKAILCRNNAPLLRVAWACIAARVRFYLANDAFAKGLIRDIRAVCRNPQTDSLDWMLAQLYTRWNYHELRGAVKELMHDKFAAVQAMCERCSSPAAICFELANLFRVPNQSDSNRGIFLSTAHRAKGLEFDWVLHLDPHLIPAPYARTPEQLAQEANIAYVINSRTKNTLLFCNSDQIIIPGPANRQPRPPIRKDELL